MAKRQAKASKPETYVEIVYVLTCREWDDPELHGSKAAALAALEHETREQWKLYMRGQEWPGSVDEARDVLIDEHEVDVVYLDSHDVEFPC